MIRQSLLSFKKAVNRKATFMIINTHTRTNYPIGSSFASSPVSSTVAHQQPSLHRATVDLLQLSEMQQSERLAEENCFAAIYRPPVPPSTPN